MAKATRRLIVGMAMGVALAGTGRAAAADNGSTATRPVVSAMTRVRSSHPVIRSIIREAAERSLTFHGLIGVIEASDGIVYVEQGDCGHGVRACLATVTPSGANRLLQVRVDTNKADCDLMGSIGRELRHAVEVLETRNVTTTEAMYLLYSRIGRARTSRYFETAAAVQAGNKVRAEVRRSVRAAQPW